MALSQPVQNGPSDIQRELLASRYSVAAPLEAVLPGTKTAAPKAEEKHAFASRDWFERSNEKADGGRTALKNLLDRLKGMADAAEQREAAERVGAATATQTTDESGALPSASMYVPPAASWAVVNQSAAGAGSTPSPEGSGSTGGTTTPPPEDSGSTGGTGSNGNGNGLVKKLLGG